MSTVNDGTDAAFSPVISTLMVTSSSVAVFSYVYAVQNGKFSRKMIISDKLFSPPGTRWFSFQVKSF